MATSVKVTYSDGSGIRAGKTVRIETNNGMTERVTGPNGYANFDYYESYHTGTVSVDGQRCYTGPLGRTIEARVSGF